MARIDKILSTASSFVGAPLHRGALVAPPGSPLYRNVSGKSGYTAVSLAVGAVKSKNDGDHLTGQAGEFPPEFGLLATSDTEVVYLKTKKLNGAATDVLARWPADEVTLEYMPKEGKMRNPAVRMTFADGTDIVLFGEKKWGMETLK